MRIALIVACMCFLLAPVSLKGQAIQIEDCSGDVPLPPQPVSDASAAGIHLGGDRRDFSSPVLTDTANFRWDILFNGCIGTGTNMNFDGAVCIFSDGVRVDEGTSTIAMRAAADGKEIELGPWQKGGLRVYRRVAVPQGKLYCRWIDLYENSSDAEIRPVIRYRTDVRRPYPFMGTTTGEEKITPKDWGLFTAPAATSSTIPSVCHFFGSQRATLRPAVTAGKNSHVVECEFRLTIPAGKTVALCLFESQQQTMDMARRFLTTFDPAAEIEGLPAELKGIIVNIGPASAAGAAGLDVPRLKDADLLITRGGAEYRGTLAVANVTVATAYGKIDLSAGQVVGMVADPMNATWVRVGLCDGQVVAGELQGALPSLKLADGNAVTLPLSQVKLFSYRVSNDRPATPAARPMLVTAGGMRLAFDANTVDLVLRTQIGAIKLRPQAMHAIALDTAGGLHRAMLRNGSVISGLLDSEKFAPALVLPLKAPTRLSQFTQIYYQPVQPAGPNVSMLTLTNDDVIIGRLAREIRVKLATEELVVQPANLAQLSAVADTVDTVEVRLYQGAYTNCTGQLIGRTIPFAMDDGAELKVFVAHVAALTNPKAPGTSASAPATKPAATPNMDVVVDPTIRTKPEDIKDALAIVAERRTALQAAEKTAENLKLLNDLDEQEATLKNKLAQLDATSAELDAMKSQLAEVGAMVAKLDAEAQTDEQRAKLAAMTKEQAILKEKIGRLEAAAKGK